MRHQVALGRLVGLAAVIALLLNALLLRRQPHWRWMGIEADAPPQRAWRIHGWLSILLWLGVISAGRLIGYR